MTTQHLKILYKIKEDKHNPHQGHNKLSLSSSYRENHSLLMIFPDGQYKLPLSSFYRENHSLLVIFFNLTYTKIYHPYINMILFGFANISLFIELHEGQTLLFLYKYIYHIYQAEALPKAKLVFFEIINFKITFTCKPRVGNVQAQSKIISKVKTFANCIAHY